MGNETSILLRTAYRQLQAVSVGRNGRRFIKRREAHKRFAQLLHLKKMESKALLKEMENAGLLERRCRGMYLRGVRGD